MIKKSYIVVPGREHAFSILKQHT